mgnify:CR=1 FL=1
MPDQVAGDSILQGWKHGAEGEKPCGGRFMWAFRFGLASGRRATTVLRSLTLHDTHADNVRPSLADLTSNRGVAVAGTRTGYA